MVGIVPHSYADPSTPGGWSNQLPDVIGLPIFTSPLPQNLAVSWSPTTVCQVISRSLEDHWTPRPDGRSSGNCPFGFNAGYAPLLSVQHACEQVWSGLVRHLTSRRDSPHKEWSRLTKTCRQVLLLTIPTIKSRRLRFVSALLTLPNHPHILRRSSG